MSEPANDYHRMGIAAKQRHALASAREPALRCASCAVAVDVRDLLSHLERRCAGRPPPHRHAWWLSHAEAIALVPRATLSRFVAAGVVRVRGRARRRMFLARDVIAAVAQRLVTTDARRRTGPPSGRPSFPSGAARQAGAVGRADPLRKGDCR